MKKKYEFNINFPTADSLSEHRHCLSGSISACAPKGNLRYEPTGTISACAPKGNLRYEPTGTISACAPNVSTYASDPICVEKITPEMIVDAAHKIKEVTQSEIYKFDQIVNVFNEKNDLLRQCLFFLSYFVDDDFCNDLKVRIENHLGIKYNKKGE